MKSAIKKELIKTKKYVSKWWKFYGIQKPKILVDESLDYWDKKSELKLLIEKVRKNISNEYEVYRENKYSLLHKEEIYPGLKLVRKFETLHTKQIFVKVIKIKQYDVLLLDDLLLQIFSEKNCNGVGIVLRVKYEKTKLLGHVSKFYTPIGIKRLHERGGTIFNDLGEKLKTIATTEYELLGIYIRIIYEKPKESSK